MIPPRPAGKSSGAMRVDPVSGIVAGVRFVASPNCDARPDGLPVDTLVIHSISLPPGQFGGPGVEQLFCNCLNSAEHPYYREISGLRVSAHFLIRRNGEIVQFVPLHQRAWHAGQSYCDGRMRANDFSIGIELEGTDDLPFENAQYESLTQLTEAVRRHCPAITREHVYGHGDIAPGRKTDPGPMFDWGRYLKSLT